MINTGRDKQEQNIQGAIAEIVKAGQQVLSTCLGELIDLAKDTRFRNDPRAQDPYTRYDALDALKTRHKTITVACLTHAESHFTNPEPSQPAPEENDPWGIQIIEPDDIEFTEAAETLAISLQKNHMKFLLPLELRLDYLNKRSPYRVDPRGWHPQALLLAFSTSIKALGIKLEGKLLLCECFREQLSIHLKDFYQELNQILCDRGILNNEQLLSKAISIKRSQTQSAKKPHSHAVKSGKQIAADTPELKTTSTSQKPRPPSGQSSASSNAGHDTEHQAKFDHFLHLLIAADAPGTGSMLSPYQRAQIVGALSLTQRDCALNDRSPNDHEIKASLARTLYDSGIFNASDLVAKETPAMDFVARIFKTVSEDASLSKTGKRLISKLQIPTIKLALLDFNFFKNPNHPARKVLNLLTTLSVGLENEKDPNFPKVQTLVHSILKQFDTKISVFERVLSELDKMVIKDKVSEIQAPSGNNHDTSLSAARGAVTHTIKNHLKNSNVHRQTLKFILECWGPYMMAVYLKKGPKSDTWKQAITYLTQLLAHPKNTESKQKAGAYIAYDNKMLSEIEARLSEVFPTHATAFRIFDELRRQCKIHHHQGHDTDHPDPDKTSPILSIEELCGDDNLHSDNTIKQGSQTQPFATDANAKKPAKPHRDLPSALKPGTWFEIHIAEGRGKRLLKFCNILEEANQILFTNRSGVTELSINLDTFLGDLKKGLSKPFDDSNLFDRALSTVISNIQDAHSKR